MNKDIYFFWESDHMPFTHFLSLWSCRKFNPDWNIYLVHKTPVNRLAWATGAFETRHIDYTNYFPRLSSLNITILDFDKEFPEIVAIDPEMCYLHAKDLVAWKVMETRGGIFSDTDIIFVKPLEDLRILFNSKKSKIGLIQFAGEPRANYIPVSFMMSNKSEFFGEAFRRATSTYHRDKYESCGADCIQGETLGTISRKYPKQVFRIPEKCVFPFSGRPIGRMLKVVHFRAKTMPKDTFAFHWYNGLQVHKYDEKNYRNFNNTFCNTIKRIWGV